MFDIKLFVRNLIRNKFYTLITVLGFSIALTFVIILGVYIRQELSVDQFHINKDRISLLVGSGHGYLFYPATDEGNRIEKGGPNPFDLYRGRVIDSSDGFTDDRLAKL